MAQDIGRMCVEPPWERVEPFKSWVGATSRPQTNGLLYRGKLWLEERTPEKVKGKGNEVLIISVGWDEVVFEPTSPFFRVSSIKKLAYSIADRRLN